MSDSVIFAIHLDDSVLCEWRDSAGTMRNCILGGSIEASDLRHDDYIFAAVVREAREETGIEVKQCDKLGQFVNQDVTFHVVLVKDWSGMVPDNNRDNGNELRWVPLNALIDSIALGPLKEVMSKLKDPGQSSEARR